MRHILLSILVWNSAAFAGRVIELGPKQAWLYVSRDTKVWKLADKACVLNKGKAIACGEITKLRRNFAKLELKRHDIYPTTPRINKGKAGTFIHLDFRKLPIKIGSKVVHESTLRKPASTPGPINEVSEGLPELNHFELLQDDVAPLNAATIGLNYVFPTLHVQQALTKHFAIGLGAVHMNYPRPNGHLRGFGGLLSFNWYSDAPFTGAFIHFSLGAYDLRAEQTSVTESIVGFTGILNFGWKWRWSWGLNFGAGLGIQGFTTTSQEVANVDIPTIIPSIALDIGFAF